MEEADLSTQKQTFDIETEPLSPNKNPVIPARYACKIIRLNPGISSLNFASCMINSTSIVFAFIITGMLQPLILLDKNYFNVDQQYSGSVTSLALFVDLVVKMLVLVPYGYCSDKLGRKVIIYYGAVSFLVGCILMSTQTSVFPAFILAKVFLANGSCALHSAPLLADYTADESKGRASALSVLFIGITSVVANLFIKILLYEKMSLGKCYFITSVVVVCIILVNSFGLKSGIYHAPTNARADHSTSSDTLSTAETATSMEIQPTINVSILSKFKDAAKIFKENGWLQIALVLHVVAMSSTFIFFTYMSLYVKSMFPEDTEDNTANVAVNNIQTFSTVPSFLSTLSFGYLLDKKNNKAFKMSFIAIGGVIISFTLMLFSNGPSDLTLICAAILMGAKPGIFVLSNYLSIKNYPADKRGVMVGFMGMVSNTLYFLIASSAGLLYDNWMKKGPFVFGIVLMVIGLLLVFVIYKRKIINKGL